MFSFRLGSWLIQRPSVKDLKNPRPLYWRVGIPFLKRTRKLKKEGEWNPQNLKSLTHVIDQPKGFSVTTEIISDPFQQWQKYLKNKLKYWFCRGLRKNSIVHNLARSHKNLVRWWWTSQSLELENDKIQEDEGAHQTREIKLGTLVDPDARPYLRGLYKGLISLMGEWLYRRS